MTIEELFLLFLGISCTGIFVIGFVLFGIFTYQVYECDQWLNQPVPDGTQWIELPTLLESHPKTPGCEWRINQIGWDVKRLSSGGLT